ncbi:hypothetical protein, partial [Plasmodium yoelii yoelii]
VKNIYKYIKKKKYTYNCKGFENIIKSVSIIIEYNIYSFFINQDWNVKLCWKKQFNNK